MLLPDEKSKQADKAIRNLLYRRHFPISYAELRIEMQSAGKLTMAKVSEKLPVVKHLYQNYMMDTLRWNFFTPRADDIVVATTYKAGTTWVQTIVANLIFGGKKLPGSLHDLAPWLDQRLFPLELVLTRLEQQTHRRSIKTHLPLDGLPFHESIKYVYVGRDPRDVFMSFWNFYGNFSPQMIAAINGIPGRVGANCRSAPTIFTSCGTIG